MITITDLNYKKLPSHGYMAKFRIMLAKDN
jgi:hypothetical protein